MSNECARETEDVRCHLVAARLQLRGWWVERRGTSPRTTSAHNKKERKKTNNPREGWEEDKVPTCTSRIL